MTKTTKKTKKTTKTTKTDTRATVSIADHLAQHGAHYMRIVHVGTDGNRLFIAGRDKNPFQANATKTNPARGIYNLPDGSPRRIVVRTFKDAKTATEVQRRLIGFYGAGAGKGCLPREMRERAFLTDTGAANTLGSKVKIGSAAIDAANTIAPIVGRGTENRATGGATDFANYGKRTRRTSAQKQEEIDSAFAKRYGLTNAQLAKLRKNANVTA